MQLSDGVRRFLEQPRFGVLATAGEDGLPQQTVMWFELQGDEIIMNTARGRVKDKHLLRDPRASLCVEEGYSYVTLAGAVVLDDDPHTAQADIARLARRYHGEAGAERQIESFKRQERVTIRLRIERAVVNGFDR